MSLNLAFGEDQERQLEPWASRTSSRELGRGWISERWLIACIVPPSPPVHCVLLRSLCIVHCAGCTVHCLRCPLFLLCIASSVLCPPMSMCLCRVYSAHDICVYSVVCFCRLIQLCSLCAMSNSSLCYNKCVLVHKHMH